MGKLANEQTPTAFSTIFLMPAPEYLASLAFPPLLMQMGQVQGPARGDIMHNSGFKTLGPLPMCTYTAKKFNHFVPVSSLLACHVLHFWLCWNL